MRPVRFRLSHASARRHSTPGAEPVSLTLLDSGRPRVTSHPARQLLRHVDSSIVTYATYSARRRRRKTQGRGWNEPRGLSRAGGASAHPRGQIERASSRASAAPRCFTHHARASAVTGGTGCRHDSHTGSGQADATRRRDERRARTPRRSRRRPPGYGRPRPCLRSFASNARTGGFVGSSPQVCAYGGNHQN